MYDEQGNVIFGYNKEYKFVRVSAGGTLDRNLDPDVTSDGKYIRRYSVVGVDGMTKKEKDELFRKN